MKWGVRDESARDAGKRLAFENSLGNVLLFVLAIGAMNWFGWVLGVFNFVLLLDVIAIGLAGFAGVVVAGCFSNAALDCWLEAHGMAYLSKRGRQ
jgi:uncharacterized membrane protein YedE/YeeE